MLGAVEAVVVFAVDVLAVFVVIVVFAAVVVFAGLALVFTVVFVVFVAVPPQPIEMMAKINVAAIVRKLLILIVLVSSQRLVTPQRWPCGPKIKNIPEFSKETKCPERNGLFDPEIY